MDYFTLNYVVYFVLIGLVLIGVYTGTWLYDKFRYYYSKGNDIWEHELSEKRQEDLLNTNKLLLKRIDEFRVKVDVLKSKLEQKERLIDRLKIKSGNPFFLNL